jgi:hypothetical protein
MLSAGKIDVARATEMLGELHETEQEIPVPPEPPRPPEAPAPHAPLAETRERNGARWLHIQVSDLTSGRHRVKVHVPLRLVEFGLKLGARFTDEVDSNMIHDLTEALHDRDLTGTLVEVEDLEDNERVHIFVE